MLELIFVHVPKTGGTSLQMTLLDHFESDLFRDYADRPANPLSPMNLDPDGFLRRCHASNYAELAGKRAIIGHFWIEKYAPLTATLRATLLREPIARALSHYCYWRINVDHNNPVCRYVIENKLSFHEFCRLPQIRRYYSGLFFGGVDMERFDIIANYDALERGWHSVLPSLGLPEDWRRFNVTVGAEYSRLKTEVFQDGPLMSDLRTLLADDIDFYERWAA